MPGFAVLRKQIQKLWTKAPIESIGATFTLPLGLVDLSTEALRITCRLQPRLRALTLLSLSEYVPPEISSRWMQMPSKRLTKCASRWA